MIYAASLAIPAKQALGEKCFQTSISKIIDTLPIDPEASNMDAVILGPKDLFGPVGMKVQHAVRSKHPNICVIYLFEKDNQKDMLDCEYKKQVKKIKDAAVFEAHKEFLSDHMVRTGKQQVISKDLMESQKEVAPTVEEKTMRVTEEPFELNLRPEESIEKYTLPLEEVDSALDFEAVQETIEKKKPSTLRIEDTLAAISNYEDWNLFQEQLKKDSVTRKLIEENTEYVGLLNMLEVMDNKIDAIWRDPALSATQKFDKIKEIGMNKSIIRSKSNLVQVDKVLRIIETIALAAKRTVETKIDSVNQAMYKITTDKTALLDSTNIDDAISQRTNIQLELMNIMRSLIDLYKGMDLLVVDSIKDLDDKLPSANMFINEMVKPISTTIFTPTNSSELATRLMQALQENRIMMSQLESHIKQIISMIFQLCDKDNEIIQYQQNMINLLKANRVEDIVLRDSLLKNVLRIYTGDVETGTTVTSLTWCGILSRRQNTLLIDMTGRRKLNSYGVEVMQLEDFLIERVEKQFLCVESDANLDPEELQEVLSELKTRLNYYPFINIIVDPSKVDMLDQLSEDALTVHYITDCSKRSIETMRNLVAVHKTPNIAHKLIMIDTPVNPLMIADKIGIDPTMTKVITIPNSGIIKACSLRGDRPYEYDEVVRIYEEAFR